MSSKMRQRGGGKSGNGIGSSTSSAATSPPEKNEERKINEDMARVIAARSQFDQASTSWRSYLFKISVVLILLAAHQTQRPMEVCLADIKEHNTVVGSGTKGEMIDISEAFMQVLRNGMCEWVGIALAGVLGKFLSLENASAGDFSATPYVMASMLFPLQMSIYIQMKDGVGCAGRGLGGIGVFDSVSPSEAMDENANRTRQFPIAGIFHVIVTLSLMWLKYGRDKTVNNAKKVVDMKQKLDEAKKKAGVTTF